MLDIFPHAFSRWINNRKTHSCHRQLLIIEGDVAGALWKAHQILAYLDVRKALMVNITDQRFTNIHYSKYREYLGQEFEAIVYNSHSGMSANSIAALAGTIKRHGLFIIISPELSKWSYRGGTSFQHQESQKILNLFTTWFVKCIQSDKQACVLSPHSFSGELATVKIDNKSQASLSSYQLKQQQDFIERMLKEYQNTSEFKCLLTAERGRGKSSALGIITARVLNNETVKVAVTAPNKRMVTNLFKHLEEKLEQPSAIHQVSFVPVDLLIKGQQKYDLIIIDEVAAIPTPILKNILQQNSKVLMSTTTDGYEGSGKGVEIRTIPYLDSHFKSVKYFELTQPIRWYQGDALERFIGEACFTNTTIFSHPPNGVLQYDQMPEKSLEASHELISAQDLVEAPNTLKDIVALLLQAHYQTTPDDFMRMLNDEDQSIHILKSTKQQVLGVALVNNEGGDNLAPLADKIASGERRVNGNFIPQRLALYTGNHELLLKRYARIMRIAIYPHLQRLGLGSKLVNCIISWAKKEKFDCLSTSYGATPELIKFWSDNHFLPARMGIKPDASSGLCSIVMLHKLDSHIKQPENESLNAVLNSFGPEFNFQLTKRLSWLDQKTAHAIKNTINNSFSTRTYDKLTQLEIKKVKQFIEYKRPIYTCEWAISKILKELGRIDTDLNSENLTVNKNSKLDNKTVIAMYHYLTDLVFSGLSDSEIAQKYELTGKKQIQLKARQSCEILLPLINPNKYQ